MATVVVSEPEAEADRLLLRSFFDESNFDQVRDGCCWCELTKQGIVVYM